MEIRRKWKKCVPLSRSSQGRMMSLQAGTPPHRQQIGLCINGIHVYNVQVQVQVFPRYRYIPAVQLRIHLCVGRSLSSSPAVVQIQIKHEVVGKIVHAYASASQRLNLARQSNR